MFMLSTHFLYYVFKLTLNWLIAVSTLSWELEKNIYFQLEFLLCNILLSPRCTTNSGFYLWVLHPVAHLSNLFFMTPSVATKFQYVNSLLFYFSLTTCFGPFRRDIQLDSFRTIFNTTDPLHVRKIWCRDVICCTSVLRLAVLIPVINLSTNIKIVNIKL
jgi:hypothetical protein